MKMGDIWLIPDLLNRVSIGPLLSTPELADVIVHPYQISISKTYSVFFNILLIISISLHIFCQTEFRDKIVKTEIKL